MTTVFPLKEQQISKGDTIRVSTGDVIPVASELFKPPCAKVSGILTERPIQSLYLSQINVDLDLFYCLLHLIFMHLNQVKNLIWKSYTIQISYSRKEPLFNNHKELHNGSSSFCRIFISFSVHD